MKRTQQISMIAGAALGLSLSAAAVAQTTTDRGYEAELAADAAGRASLLQSGATAGHNRRGFYIGSGDGNYNLYIGGYTQFRYILSFADDDSIADSEDFGNGFDQTRTRLIFQGNVINPNLTFYVEGAFDGNADGGTLGSDGSFTLLDYWGQYEFDNGVGIKFGQFKAPVTRERMVDARHQLAADRSVVDEVFNAGRVQGVALTWRNDSFGIIGGIHDGARTANTPFHGAGGATYTGIAGIDPMGQTVVAESDIALTARVEGKLAGDWDRFEDFTSFRNSQDLAAMIGGAFHWQHHGDTAAWGSNSQVASGEADVLVYTIDASVEGNGWNLYGAFIGANGDIDGGGDIDNFGFLVQGGFFLSEQFELFGRWDVVLPDDDAPGDDDMHTFTIGGNYYFVPESHAAKFTADVQWFTEQVTNSTPVTTVAPSSTTALVPSNDDDQFAVRFQMQLAF